MAVSYDEKVIVEFADRLYQRAAFIVASYVAMGAILGGVVAFGVSLPWLIIAIIAIIAIIGALLGGLLGNERAFALRLTAQSALCQVQIERNTRPTTGAIAALPSENPRNVATSSSERPVPEAGAIAPSDSEAKALIKRAQDHHFAREFTAAIALYEEVVTRFPESKQATLARTQIKNLK